MFLLFPIYALVVMIIGFTLSHMFNRIYPQHNVGWIMLFPSIYITIALGLVAEAKGFLIMFETNIMGNASSQSEISNYLALSIESYIGTPLILLATLPLVYRGLNFNKTILNKLKLNARIATGIVVLIMFIKIITKIVNGSLLAIFDDIIIIALSFYAHYKYIKQIPLLYNKHNHQVNMYPTSNMSQCTKVKESISSIQQKELYSCPICGEDIEVGLHICPYCHEKID
nr:hypothetical protein [uncultured Prevotella sp.]